MANEKTKDVIMATTLDGLGTEAFSDYLCHALVTGGECRIVYNGAERILHESDLLIVRKGRLVENIVPSAEFRVLVAYVTTPFVELRTPV